MMHGNYRDRLGNTGVVESSETQLSNLRAVTLELEAQAEERWWND